MDQKRTNRFVGVNFKEGAVSRCKAQVSREPKDDQDEEQENDDDLGELDFAQGVVFGFQEPLDALLRRALLTATIALEKC